MLSGRQKFLFLTGTGAAAADPGEPVRDRDRPAGTDAQLLAGELADREDGRRGQQGLRHDQRGRGGKDPEERGQDRDDRLEVITEQVEARALMSTIGARRPASLASRTRCRCPDPTRTG